VKEINETTEAVKDQYSATPYSRENINQTVMENLQLMISDQLFLNVTLVETKLFPTALITKKKT